ncbi:response regulator [Desulfococcaceae bacterium HSG9]|nr:response regulator [Desulfococcaceae bacterium HSG9]
MPTILAIDDRQDNLFSLLALLKSMIPGCTVVTASSGKQGIEKAKTENPDTILLDIYMPIMDGFEACRILKSDPATKHIPVIMLTAVNTDSTSRVKGLEIGADAFLTKPIDRFELTAQVNAMLRIKKAEDILRKESEILEQRVEERTAELVKQTEQLKAEIQERHQVEKALKESEQRYSLLFNISHDAIFVHGITNGVPGKFTEVNDSTCKRLGYSREELMRMSPIDIDAGGMDEDRRLALEMMEKNGHCIFEMVHVSKAGHKIPVEISSRVFESAGERYVLSIARDITERKLAEQEKQRLEMQLRQQQKLESIGTLASGVAHEINNPINGVMNYAQLIVDQLNKDNPLTEYATEIIHETKRVSAIVRNLLQFSRCEKRSHSPARITDIADGTLSLIKTVIRHDQIMLEIDIPDDLPEIKCHSQQIQQVLMNLLTNARDAINERYPDYDPDKIITMTVRPFEKAGRHWLRITVEDRGAGIPDKIRERLFDPFFTTKDRAKGTGLGLSISQGIVHDHCGELSFECERGEYTRFHLDLPVDNGWYLGEVSET